MSKRDEKIAQYQAESKKLDLGLTEDLIEKVTVGLGPSIYKKDSETVACSSADELDRVKTNFITKKLGLELSEEEMTKEIEAVCKKMGSANRTKYRALFYALLVKSLKKEDVYA